MQLDCLIKFYLDFTKQNKKAMIKFTPAAQYLQRSSRAVHSDRETAFCRHETDTLLTFYKMK